VSTIHYFEFRALLQARRSRLLDELREGMAVPKECLGFAHQPKIAEVDAFKGAATGPYLAMAGQEGAELQEIEAALARIGAGRYGICIDCGGEIGRAPLKADPTAKRCTTCRIPVLPALPTMSDDNLVTAWPDTASE
jgi:RNA polymerase-binding transcription factor DksA